MATRRRLKTIQDIRRYIASLINRTEHSEIDPNVASKLGFLAVNLAKIIESSSLEQRIEALEIELSSKSEKPKIRRVS